VLVESMVVELSARDKINLSLNLAESYNKQFYIKFIIRSDLY
jgi:hypothetical protein